MGDFDDLSLLSLFHQCSHYLHASGKYRGQGRVMILLSEQGTLTQRELIDMTGRRSATLSEQLDNMEKAGYITRARNDQDRRNVDVSLTPEGREMAENVKVYRKDRANRLFAALSEEEKEQLFGLLHKLLGTWKEIPSEKEFPSESEAAQR